MAQIFYESYYGITPQLGDSIMHYQVKGAKHGVRRYQNYDGSYTPLGREHYGIGEARDKARTDKDKPSKSSGSSSSSGGSGSGKKLSRLEQFSKDWEEGREISRQEKAQRKTERKEKTASAVNKVKNAVKNASKKLADKQVDKVIKRANPDELKKYMNRMSTDQLAEFNKRLGLRREVEETTGKLTEAQRQTAETRNELNRLNRENRKAGRRAALEGISNTVDAVSENANKIYGAIQNFKSRRDESLLKAYESGTKMENARDAYNTARNTREENQEVFKRAKADRKAGITPEMRERMRRAVEASFEYSNKLAREEADRVMAKAKSMGLGGEKTQQLVDKAIHKVWGGRGEWTKPNENKPNDNKSDNKSENKPNNNGNQNNPNDNKSESKSENKPNNNGNQNQPNNNSNQNNNNGNQNKPNNNGNQNNNQNQPNNNQPEQKGWFRKRKKHKR